MSATRATPRQAVENDTIQDAPTPVVDSVPEEAPIEIDSRDAEIELLRRQLDELRTENEVLAQRPAPDDAPLGHVTVLPKGTFDIWYGGRRYFFEGGVRVAVPDEVAGYLRGQVLQDPTSGVNVTFRGDSLYQ